MSFSWVVLFQKKNRKKFHKQEVLDISQAKLLPHVRTTGAHVWIRDLGAGKSRERATDCDPTKSGKSNARDSFGRQIVKRIGPADREQ